MPGLFGKISSRYDLMNTIITFGQDRLWRRQVVEMATVRAGGRLLDVGAGTGAIGREALRSTPGLQVTAVDFSPQMVEVGRRAPWGEKITWCLADALDLPFPDATFDAVTSGYLVRNVIDVRRAFMEQVRVAKPGGRIVCLETSPQPFSVVQPLVLFYLKVLIPLLGCLIARNRRAYRYLGDSTQAFLRPEQLASIMSSSGVKGVSCVRIMRGTQVVMAGTCPLEG
jgi:demethylmenaquinone methyltransferase/2-methoxy-6-polyprenyl-1,4-benzoquinol methylase